MKQFLEKFAELEKRVRKLVISERAQREELERLRGQAREAEARADDLGRELEEERRLRLEALDRVDELISRLEGLREEPPREAASGGKA